MKTYSFIGSDKNAGKTTALKAVYRQMQADARDASICLTSIGINGEEADSYEGGSKPTIRLGRGSCFITHGEHLRPHTGKYEILASYRQPEFSRDYILGRCLLGFVVVLEGPNSGREILEIKKDLGLRLPTETILLIDGSIDRQFLAQPQISDAFFFAVLFSRRPQQQQKTRDFLFSLAITPCPEETATAIRQQAETGTKSLLLDKRGLLRYRGRNMAYADQDLLQACEDCRTERCSLYLNGAFPASLQAALACYDRLEVVLNNFSQYLNISIEAARKRHFYPKLFLLHPVRIKAIYIKQEGDFDPGLLPERTQAINLFRTDRHEIAF